MRDGLSQPPTPFVAHSRWKPPSSRQSVRFLTAPSETLRKNDARFVDAVRAASPVIAEAADLARRFDDILVGRNAAEFDQWLAQLLGSAIASLREASGATLIPYAPH
ncbi:hypothetical protein KRR38_32905 [Novosphingobium sp. G106]|uniref:hypothetical protein n=1 Tax=Novosphingobium sp. G106 TaxID=2849500 RepID=UPI001C2CE926|nr:hypothetical protein [Novosphingobium sp. G106]MBV1692327.1 hypothetical protein [Novosphingobium sp. G106]